jgi:MarR-like DNA-binding transcriptional regulator SgrR of sgrS sRNA
LTPKWGAVEKYTLAQIKDALDQSADNITESAVRLGCSRETLYNYINKYPELQEHRKVVVATLNDFAESTVKQEIRKRNITVTMAWLKQKHPEWTQKQIIEHAGTLNVTAGLLTSEQITAMSDADLQKMITVRKAELTALEADDVRDEGAIEGSPPTTDSPG